MKEIGSNEMVESNRFHLKGFTLIPKAIMAKGDPIAIAEKQISAEAHLILVKLMVSLEQCKIILNNSKIKYSNAEIKLIRDFLYEMAKLQLETENIINI